MICNALPAKISPPLWAKAVPGGKRTSNAAASLLRAAFMA